MLYDGDIIERDGRRFLVNIEAGRVMNKGTTPLWSGKGEPPAIGSTVTCSDRVGTQVTITSYTIEDGWLLAEGYRTASPIRTGTLAGMEIRY